MIYFSDRYYVNDMGRIKVNKQPYSALSATSLKDFLDDRMFEFNLFHKIAHERFYRPRHKPGEKVDTSTSNIYSPIKDKVVEKGKNLDRLLDAEHMITRVFKQIKGEESNYFFVKKLQGTGNDWSTNQHRAYLKLTEVLCEFSIQYYKARVLKQEGEVSEALQDCNNTINGYAKLLANCSGVDIQTITKFIQKDMERREKKELSWYFSDELISLKRTKKGGKDRDEKSKKGNRKLDDQYEPTIRKLLKSPIDLLFRFEENMASVLKGFTIDVRIFFHLMRKMIIIKMNNDRIWTRQFYSQDLKKVFLILKPMDPVIESRASVGHTN